MKARTSVDIPLRCRCGRLRGVARGVSPSAGLRFICYCTDCQAFARFLACGDALDAAGGTDIFQMAPARIDISAGVEHLRCVQLSSKVLRWYAGCCATPIANTAADPRFPLAAVIHTFMDHSAAGQNRDAVLGPPLCPLFDASATAALPAGAPPRPGARLFVRRFARLGEWWLRGLARPSPFFDLATGRPRAAPQVLFARDRSDL